MAARRLPSISAVDGHDGSSFDRLFPMTLLSAFGLLAVTAMLVTYALEDRSRWFTLAFAGACGLGSLYGFLQGAWPFGLIEAVWCAVALAKWHRRLKQEAWR